MTADKHPARRAAGALTLILSAPALLGSPGAARAQDAQDAQDVTVAPEVVVSASHVPVPSREVGSAVTVLTEQDLEDRQVRFVGDVLRDVPGVAFGRSGGMGSLSQVRIRGAEGNQTLVLIDGIEVNNPSSSSEFDFQNLLNLEIARIEVLRGPQSALYGSDAIGGVINIVTKRPGPGWSGAARGEGGSFNTVNGVTHLGYGGERFYVSGGLGHHWTSGISIAEARNNNPETDHYRNYTGRLKAGLQLAPGLDIEAVGMRIDSQRQADSTISGNLLRDSNEYSETVQQYGLVGANWRLFGGAWEHRVRASHISDETDFRSPPGTLTFVSDGAKTKYDYQTSVFLDSPEWGAKHTLTVLAEREYEKQFTWSSTNGDNTKSVENYSYAGEYRLALDERWFLSGGLRYDDNDSLFKDQWTWRGTAAYLIDSWDVRLHGSVGRGVKNPTLFELFGSTPTFTGNPNLVPEEGIGWDLGVEKGFFGGRLIADVTYFQNRIRNLIDGNGSTARNLPGTTRTQGVEVSLATEPTPYLRLDAHYTFLNAQDANSVTLIRRAKHIASANATYRFDLDERPARFNLGVRYNGSQRDTAFDDSFNRFPVRLGGYTLVNAGMFWSLREGVELFARVENALDTHYQELYGYGTPGFAAFAGLSFRFGPGGR